MPRTSIRATGREQLALLRQPLDPRSSGPLTPRSGLLAPSCRHGINHLPSCRLIPSGQRSNASKTDHPQRGIPPKGGDVPRN
ncbi:hypothetical protein [Beijerinckia mobilis]|uniref:hypothetical protein n=1 Tax=Beijerinckia mobilis TaxID=231434 RepID=UPI0005571DD1|nr:hypothetical protein [Beijerinckia mobilis]